MRVLRTPEEFGLPLPPGYLVAWDPETLDVRCAWCGNVWHYSMAGYLVHTVQTDALQHRVECHTPDGAHG